VEHKRALGEFRKMEMVSDIMAEKDSGQAQQRIRVVVQREAVRADV
jgi:hypothetical protein